MVSWFYFIGSLQHSPVGGASRAITTQNDATAVTSAGILRHIKEQAQSGLFTSMYFSPFITYITILMISLDLMKSLEVRIAGDQPKYRETLSCS